MIRARSVAGPLRRAHPASGATWNVQVVRGKMSSKCLWHACRALSAGLLLMLLGAAMAVIGYYADSLSVAEEVRGNATVSVKDEARGFHLNNLSYAGPIVMGFGGFIVVAACVMTFEARDSAAKVTPARPVGAVPRPVARRPAGAAPVDALGVYRLPLVLPRAAPRRGRDEPGARAARALRTARVSGGGSRAAAAGTARYGSAPDLRSGAARAPLSAAALRRPLRRYALSVDEPPHSTLSASAGESEAGSQCSLALEVHAGAAAGATLRVRDSSREGARDARDARRRRPLARQPRLLDDPPVTPRESCSQIHNLLQESTRINNDVESNKESVEMVQLGAVSPPSSPAPAPTPSPPTPDTCILIEQPAAEEHPDDQAEPPDP